MNSYLELDHFPTSAYWALLAFRFYTWEGCDSIRTLNLSLSFYFYSFRKWLLLPSLLELSKLKLNINQKKKKKKVSRGKTSLTGNRFFPFWDLEMLTGIINMCQGGKDFSFQIQLNALVLLPFSFFVFHSYLSAHGWVLSLFSCLTCPGL